MLTGFLLAGALAALPVPVALLWVRGRRGAALAPALAAGLPALFLGGAPLMLVVSGAVALAGVLLGALARRGWSIGWCVAALALLMFCLSLISVSGTTRSDWSVFFNARAAALEAEAGGGTALAEVMKWMDERLPFVGFGLLFQGALFSAAAQAGLVFFLLRAGADGEAAPVPEGRFRTMRPPEWLVWLAILALVLWLADNRWPNDAVRFVAWNGAIALSAVYWLNGLGIALCAMEAFGLRPVMCVVLLALLFIMQAQHLLAVAGFVDTWFDQRLTAARIAAAWRARRDRDDD